MQDCFYIPPTMAPLARVKIKICVINGYEMLTMIDKHIISHSPLEYMLHCYLIKLSWF